MPKYGKSITDSPNQFSSKTDGKYDKMAPKYGKPISSDPNQFSGQTQGDSWETQKQLTPWDRHGK